MSALYRYRHFTQNPKLGENIYFCFKVHEHLSLFKTFLMFYAEPYNSSFPIRYGSIYLSTQNPFKSEK